MTHSKKRLNRRGFIGAAATTTLGIMPAKGALQSPSSKSDMKITDLKVLQMASNKERRPGS